MNELTQGRIFIAQALDLDVDIDYCNEEIRFFGALRRRHKGDACLYKQTGKIMSAAIREKEDLLEQKEQLLSIGAKRCASAMMQGSEVNQNFLLD